MKEALALLALMTLSHIVEHQGNLAPLIEVSIDWSNNQEIFFVGDQFLYTHHLYVWSSNDILGRKWMLVILS